jgi:hypothetical protein
MAMTESHSEPSARRPMTTGEFRAAPDISASTAQFQKFAEGQAEPVQQRSAAASARNPRILLLIVAVVVVLAIIAILGATLG